MTPVLDQPAAFKLVYTPVGHFVNGHAIVRGPDGWHLFYGGRGGGDNVVRDHATSDDLLSWKAHEPFLRGEPGSWDEREIGCGCVHEHEGRWYFVYQGRSDNNGSRCIGAAVSDDMWTWTRLTDREVPPFHPDTSWSSWEPTGDRQCCKDPWIIRHGDEFLMYYSSRNHADKGVIAVARSSALLHWQDEGPIVTAPWQASATIPSGFEVPRVVEHSGRYYLFSLNFWGLQYSIGGDPFHFGDPRVLGPWHASVIFNDADRVVHHPRLSDPWHERTPYQAERKAPWPLHRRPDLGRRLSICNGPEGGVGRVAVDSSIKLHTDTAGPGVTSPSA